jgi:uncharacterized repeat protein (TIGR03803 family)
VFEIPYVSGSYASTPTVLASFNGTNGASPRASLIADAAGDLFGTTSGNNLLTNTQVSDGTVFELVKNGGGSYTLNTLVSFNGVDGDQPLGSLIADAAGDLFGTTSLGGANGAGTVFEIPYVNGSYASTPTVMFSFSGANGAGPGANLIADAAGDLFGTTYGGGPPGFMGLCSLQLRSALRSRSVK